MTLGMNVIVWGATPAVSGLAVGSVVALGPRVLRACRPDQRGLVRHRDARRLAVAVADAVAALFIFVAVLRPLAHAGHRAAFVAVCVVRVPLSERVRQLLLSPNAVAVGKGARSARVSSRGLTTAAATLLFERRDV